MRILSLLSLLLTLTAVASPSIPRQVQESAAFIIEEAFVIPERGAAIARELRAKTLAPDLEGKALADALTAAIQSIEDDGHLNVRFVPEKASTPLASKEEIRERLRQRSAMPPPRSSDEPQVSSRMEGHVGILELNSFAPRPGAADEIAAAMARLEGARAVIVDLRKNGGGAQFLVDLLASYFFPEDDRVLLTARMRGMPQPLVSRVVATPTRAFENVPLAVLISERTFSAGEAFAYVLQQFGRAEVIGAKTRGGGRPNRIVDIGGGYLVSVSVGMSEHPKTGTGWQTTGVVPDVAVPAADALSVATKRLVQARPLPPAPASASAARNVAPKRQLQSPSPAMGARIEGIIRAFNSKPEEHERLVAEAFAPSMLAEGTPAQRSEVLRRIQQDFGTLEIRELRRESETRVAIGITGSTGLRGVVVMDHELAAPHKITNLLFRIGDGGSGPGPGPGPASASAPGPGPDRAALPPVPVQGSMAADELSSALDAYLARLSTGDQFAGTVLVARNGQALFEKSYGMANRSDSVPNTPRTRFNVGSINKRFTSIAIAQLVAAGKLATSGTIAQYLPGHPNVSARDITLQQLLDMTAGLADFFGPDFDAAAKHRFRRNRDYYEWVAAKPLLFEPGARKEYCNACYIVLGEIVERDEIAPNVALGYTRRDGALRNNLLIHGAGGSAAGSGHATARDLLALDEALRRSVLLDRAGVTAFFKLGDQVNGRAAGMSAYAGGAPGINGAVSSGPVWTVIALANVDPPAADALAAAIYRSLADTK